jgi:hypothetical protein
MIEDCSDDRVSKALKDYPDWLQSMIKELDWVELFEMMENCIEYHECQSPIVTMAEYFGIKRVYNVSKYRYEYVDKYGNILN